jgi:hypothetical protein
MKRVRSDVVETTKQKQVPWDHSSLRSDVVLAKSTATVSADVGSLADTLSRDGAQVLNQSQALAAECDRAAADPFDTNKPANVRGVHRHHFAPGAAALRQGRGRRPDQSEDAVLARPRALRGGRLRQGQGRVPGRGQYRLPAGDDRARAHELLRPRHVAQLRRRAPTVRKGGGAGHPSAIKNLGFMHDQGRGVKPDVQKAISYYQ